VDCVDVGNLKPEAHTVRGLGWRALVEFEKPTTEEVDDTAVGYLAPFAVPGQPDAFVEGSRLLEMGRP
jgi:hypothetical protein